MKHTPFVSLDPPKCEICKTSLGRWHDYSNCVAAGAIEIEKAIAEYLGGLEVSRRPVKLALLGGAKYPRK